MRALYVLGIGSLAVATTIGASGIRVSRAGDRDVSATAWAPNGSVELSSFGVVGIATDDDHPLAALHVRAIVRNARDVVPWTFDAGDARVDRGVAPMLANSDIATLPIAIVDRGERAVVDLYFPIAEVPTAFDVAVNVVAGARSLAATAHFVADDEPAPGAALGEGRRWWSAPYFAWPSFRHVDGIITPRPPRHATVTQAPVRRFVAR